MIIRIFIALLALNMVAFVVRAEAADRVHDGMTNTVSAVELYEQQKRAAGNYDESDDNDNIEAFSEIGSRLLTLSLYRSDDNSRRYASQPAQPDHGIALMDEGACLNLKWNF